MEFKEIIAELDKLKDTEDYKNYIGGFMTPDRVSAYLETEDGKKFIQPVLDKYHTKGLDSWKTNNLEKLIDAEVKKRHPEADPAALELEKLKADIESMKRETARKDLLIAATKAANEKGLPVELVDYLIGEDADTTNTNIAAFEKAFNGKLAEAVEAKIKGDTHVPPDNNKSGTKDPFLEGLGL